MASLNVTGNFSTSSNTLNVRYTTDAQNITKMEITKDNTNFITADSFTNSDAVFNVSTWDNGTYTCKLRMTHTEATTYTSGFADILYNATIWNVFGDSISEGYNVTEAQTWHSLISSDSQFSHITKYNTSLSASAITDGGRVDSFVERYTQLNANADLVTIFGGVNDYLHNMALGNKDDTVTTTFYGAINTLIPGIKSRCPNARIVWMSPMKTEWSSSDRNELGFHLLDYIQAIQYKCREFNIEYVDLYEVGELDPVNYSSNYEDGLHPTPTGHSKLKQYLLNVATVSIPPQYKNTNLVFTKGKGMHGNGEVIDAGSTYFTTLSLYDVTPNTQYFINVSKANYLFIAYYDSNNNYLDAYENDLTNSGIIDNVLMKSVVPPNAFKIRVALTSEDINEVTGTLTKEGTTPTPDPTPDPTPEPTPNIALYNISNMTVDKGKTFNILYSSNISAVKHEFSWDGGSTFWDKTSEIVVSNSTNYKYTHEAKTDVSSYNMAIRVTDAKGNTSTKTFTITFNEQVVNNFTFTQYKKLDQNGNVVATDDATFYTTVNLNAVEARANYKITLNSGNYIVALFYDSDGNILEEDVEANTPDWSYQAGFSTTFTVPANASYIRVSAVNNSQVTGTLTKESADTPSNPGSNLLDASGAYLLDDFTGTSLDRSKWDYEWGYVRNGELQNYQDTNAVVNNGILELQGRKDGNGTWTAASIISKGHFAFMYGKIECRAKIDPTWGSFSAFWTLGDSFEFGYHNWASPDTLGEWWAWCGEFDVMEFYSGKLTCGTFFNEREESGRVWYNNYDFNAWHTFAMEWLENGTLIFSIDGHELSRTNPTDNRAFHIPHFILINQAIGASGGTPADSTTAITQYVDWVKYYPASTNNVVLYTSDFSIAATDRNDNNCVVRATFHDNCINKVLSWSCDRTDIATVHSGLVAATSGSANGTVNITATSPSGVSQTLQLNVVNGKIQ